MTALLTAERFRPQTQANSPVVPETSRFADSLTLAATHAAIGCAQMFVSHTLYHWSARFIEDDALLAVTELVTSAVKATGVMDEHPRWWELDHLNLIRVRLLGMDASIVIEVWDSDPEPPELMNPRWHCLQPRSGGKGRVVRAGIPSTRHCARSGAGTAVAFAATKASAFARPHTLDSDRERSRAVAAGHRWPHETRRRTRR